MNIDFSKMDSQMKKVTISIIGSVAPPNDAGDSFELMTDGEYSVQNGCSAFSYVESALTGFEGTLTTFAIEQDRIVLRRAGGQSPDMIFSEKQKHHFLYETPMGAITMGIDTHSIKHDLHDQGGNIEIKYDIEVDNVPISHNTFKINIWSAQ